MMVCSFTPSRMGTICSILSKPFGGSVGCGVCACSSSGQKKESADMIKPRDNLVVIEVLLQLTGAQPSRLHPAFDGLRTATGTLALESTRSSLNLPRSPQCAT